MYFLGCIFSLSFLLGQLGPLVFAVENQLNNDVHLIDKTKKVLTDIFYESGWRTKYDFFWHVAQCPQSRFPEDLQLFYDGKYWAYKHSIPAIDFSQKNQLRNSENNFFCTKEKARYGSLVFHGLVPHQDYLMHHFSSDKIPAELGINPGLWAYDHDLNKVFFTFRGTHALSYIEHFNNLFFYKHQLSAIKNLLKKYPVKNALAIDIHQMHQGFLAFLDISIDPLGEVLEWIFDQDFQEKNSLSLYEKVLAFFKPWFFSKKFLEEQKNLTALNMLIKKLELKKWYFLGYSRGGAVAIITQLFFPHLIVKAVHQWFDKKGFTHSVWDPLRKKMIHALMNVFEKNSFVITYAAPKLFFDAKPVQQVLNVKYLEYAKNHIVHIYSPFDLVPKFFVPGLVNYQNPGIHILDFVDLIKSTAEKRKNLIDYFNENHFLGFDYLKGLVLEKLFDSATTIKDELNIVNKLDFIELSLKKADRALQ